MKKLSVILTLLILIVFVVGVNQVLAGPNLADEIDKIQNSGTILGNEQDGAKDKLRKLSKDGTDIVGIVVMAVLMISGLWTAVKFAGAGDQPAKKQMLKASLVMHILGIVFLANYFGFISFAFDKLKIF